VRGGAGGRACMRALRPPFVRAVVLLPARFCTALTLSLPSPPLPHTQSRRPSPGHCRPAAQGQAAERGEAEEGDEGMCERASERPLALRAIRSPEAVSLGADLHPPLSRCRCCALSLSPSLQHHTGRVAGHRRPAVPGLGALRHPPAGAAHHAVPVRGERRRRSGEREKKEVIGPPSPARAVRVGGSPQAGTLTPSDPLSLPSLQKQQPPQGLPGHPAPAAGPAEHADRAVREKNRERGRRPLPLPLCA